MNNWQLILGMMAVTVVVRYPVLALMGRLSLPRPIDRGLRYVPVAILTAISVPEILSPDGNLDLSIGNSHLLAGALAVAIAWATKNLLLTIVAGMGLFLGLRFLV